MDGRLRHDGVNEARVSAMTRDAIWNAAGRGSGQPPKMLACRRRCRRTKSASGFRLPVLAAAPERQTPHYFLLNSTTKTIGETLIQLNGVGLVTARRLPTHLALPSVEDHVTEFQLIDSGWG